MNSLVLGVMSRFCARIIGKAICPQKSCCRRSFSNAGHHGMAVRRDEIIDAAVVQAGNYWLRHSLLANPVTAPFCRAISSSAQRVEKIKDQPVDGIGRLLLDPMTNTLEQMNAMAITEPGNGVRISIDAGDHGARRVMSPGDEESRLFDFVSRIGAKLLHVDILGAIAIERTAESAAREAIRVIGDIRATEPGRQRVRIRQAVQKGRCAGRSYQRTHALRPVARQGVVEESDGAVWIGFKLRLGRTGKPEIGLIEKLVWIRASPELRWLAIDVTYRGN